MPHATERRARAVFLLFLLCIAILPAGAGAIAIGVNRASINFDGVLRDGFAREGATITTDSIEPVTAEVILEGPQQAWINLSARNFTFSRDNPYTLIVEVRPPSDAQVMSYRVNMSILTGELSRGGGGQIGSTARASLGVPISIVLTGTQRLACRVNGLRVLDTERGQELEVRLSVQNTGNVRVTPGLTLEVFDKLRSELVASRSASFGREILPTVTESTSLFFPLDLASDQYWASIKVPECQGSEFLTFDVLEPGGIKDDGELIRIDAESWNEVGDIIPVTAVFRNNGARSLRASFRGKIERVDDGSVVKIIQTDEVIVDPSVTADLQTFFNPTEPGKYRAVGKVFYNQKLTAEKEAIINVNGASAGIAGLRTSTWVLLVMMLGIGFLLLLIIRRKRDRMRPGPYR